MRSNIGKILIVAEIGNTHEGSLNLAKCFIRAAADCGVDAIKFQLHIFDAESLPDAPNPPYFNGETRKAYFDRTGFSVEQWKELKDFAENECRVEFFASPFSLEAVDILEQVGVKRYKIASGEVSNLPLLETVAKTGKNVVLSSGMSTWSELDEAIQTLRKNGCNNIILLQCTSEYPCLPENAGLDIMEEMRERYKLPIGFSDHTLGDEVSIAAACKGARLIEKHFTLSKLMYGPDARFALIPDEMKKLVKSIRLVERVLDSKVDKDGKAFSLIDMKKVFEKSIVSKCHIPLKTIISKNHVAFKKPGNGISASQYTNVIGKRSNMDIPGNIQIKWDMLDEA